MKLSRVIVWVTFLAIIAMSSHVSIDSDSWWHLKAGEWMVENHQIITEDPFSFTHQGVPWQYPGLWVQVFMYLLYAWFGPGALNLWVSLMVVIIFGLVWKTTCGNELERALILILAAASSAIYWAARPYLFTYLFGAVFFLLLRQFREGRRKNLYILPFLIVLWVNSHGGFLAGFLFVGPFFVEALVNWNLARRSKDEEDLAKYKQRSLHYIAILGLMFLGSLVNLQGINLWKLPFTTVSRQAEQIFIAEWQSPDFHTQSLLPFALLLILTIAILAGSNKRASLADVLLLCGFGFLSLLSVRNIFFFVIVAPAVLTEHLSGFFEYLSERVKIKSSLDFDSAPTNFQVILNISIVVIVALVAFLRVVSYLPYETNAEEFAEVYPVLAVDYLKSQHLEGNMFNSYNFGGYLIWALPEHPVFVDGRADLHQDEIILPWYSAYNGTDGWEQLFEKWDIGFVVVEPTAPIVRNLEWDNWNLVYSDAVAVVYVRPGD